MDWKTNCLIGIPEIDEQHQKLFDCIDRLETRRTSGSGSWPCTS
jgi:hypothetical protein